MTVAVLFFLCVQVFESATPSVVYINTFIETRDAFSMNMLEVSGIIAKGWTITVVVGVR